ncbi:DUF1493 family protein [Flavobacterium enshiense]|uniref:DUF1493 family protein n=1 Tax=Flavobacterium enshiense TaxID=1341165 RepID=UPI003F58DF0C
MDKITEILEFVKEFTGADNVTEESDIETEIGCYGDDFDELIEKYSKKFNVDVSSYLWYFHTGEEASFNIGSIFSKPPNELVKRIPVTPKMLLEFSEKGKWDIKYPMHKIPKIRYDMIINQIIFIGIIIWGIYYWFFK